MEKVKLRIATKEDYPVYLKYLEDKDSVYHWFFYDEDVEPVDSEEAREALDYFGIDEDWLKECFEFEKKWFFESFNYKQQYRYYIILIGNKPVGYLNYSFSGNGSWKLCDCALDVDQFDRREEIIAEAIKIKLPRATRIYTMICSKKAKEIFKKLGFHEGTCVMELSL